MKISLMALSAVMANKKNNRAGYTKLGVRHFRCNTVKLKNLGKMLIKLVEKS